MKVVNVTMDNHTYHGQEIEENIDFKNEGIYPNEKNKQKLHVQKSFQCLYPEYKIQTIKGTCRTMTLE